MIAAKPMIRGIRQPLAAKPQRAQRVVPHAVDDTNFVLNLLASGVAGALATAANTATDPAGFEKELERIKSVDGAVPIAAGIAADAVAHSIPGLNLLFNLVSEPAGAACGVAYVASLLLSASAVDIKIAGPSGIPMAMAPKGGATNLDKASDTKGRVRIPFASVIPTLIKVVDTTNDSSSGAGWTIAEDGLPKLPINSVIFVVGLGTLILELASHTAFLGAFMPRLLSVAGYLAVAGWLLDKRNQQQ